MDRREEWRSYGIDKSNDGAITRVKKNGVIEDELRNNTWIRDWCKGKDKDMGQQRDR